MQTFQQLARQQMETAGFLRQQLERQQDSLMDQPHRSVTEFLGLLEFGLTSDHFKDQLERLAQLDRQALALPEQLEPLAQRERREQQVQSALQVRLDQMARLALLALRAQREPPDQMAL
jgi:hypothetical protein